MFECCSHSGSSSRWTLNSSNTDEYLHRNGTFDATTPTSVAPATKDAGTVSFAKGNTFSVIGTWNAS